jgi:hypothetical protein
MNELNINEMKVCLSCVAESLRRAKESEDWVLHLCDGDIQAQPYRNAVRAGNRLRDVRIRLIQMIEKSEEDD